jgi:glycosyltransferase involved in cell wall biosynthesis
MNLPSPRHHVADRDDLVLAHVTAFNALFWESGSTATTVIEHGVIDPGLRYSGEVAAAAAVINEPGRRSWVAGTDLVLAMREKLPVDLFGMQSEPFGGIDLTQNDLHTQIARRRLYLHLFRWTSLGLTLIEAMMLGLPVAVLATTEAATLPSDVGIVGLSVDTLARGVGAWLADPDAAEAAGRRARTFALERFGLSRFLADWDRLLERVVDGYQPAADYRSASWETSAL